MICCVKPTRRCFAPRNWGATRCAFSSRTCIRRPRSAWHWSKTQPQVDAAGRPIGAELLLRWSHSQRGWVPPQQFIAVAEASGLIARMGARVIHQACTALARLQGQGLALSISVNVSPSQFRQADFVDQVRRTLADTGAPAELLTLEVTESLLVENWQDTASRMHELVALGVRFSIDDFGTGCTSSRSTAALCRMRHLTATMRPSCRPSCQ